MIKNAILLFCLYSFSFYCGAQSLSFEEALSVAHHGRSNRDSALFWANRAYEIGQQENSATAKYKALVYVGAAYCNLGERDTAKLILNVAVSELNVKYFEKGFGTWYLGKVNLRNAEYEKAKGHYLLAIPILESCDSVKYVSNCLTEIGLSHGMRGDYSIALEWYTKAYENKLQNGLEHKVDIELHNIANVYMRQGSYDKAIDFYRKSMKHKDGKNDHSPYIGIGGVYNLQLMSDSALYYYKEAYRLATEEKSNKGQATSAINISNIYFQKKEHRLAIEYLNKARFSKGLRNRSIPPVYTELGKNYFGLNMLDSAKYYSDIALTESKRVKYRQYIAESSEFLSRVLAAQSKFEEAYEYAMLSMTYADSINRERRDDAITDQRIRLETLKKQHEIDKLNSENRIHQYKQLLIAIGAISVAFISLLAFLNLRSRSFLKQHKLENEKKELRQELEKNIAQLSAHTLHMIHHKNGLEEIEQHLGELDGVGKQKIKNVISINKAQEKDWDNFNNYFSGVHAQLFEVLKFYHKDLTQNEIRLCALIRMNLANNEIATLLNIEPKSVKMARYRLKKKLALEEEQELNSYIQTLELADGKISWG
ncbi:tetratricopeptide repeat protein [Reichenbachiella sp.]|uniref:tetratricopeptide repeat protein n=1 Tax=Reichenbachiella sp. TaxID=2184521 RepID=UPI003B59306C